MKLFSQRQGLKPVKCALQINDLDADLRIKLWNVLSLRYWDQVSRDDLTYSSNIDTLGYLKSLWHNYLKQPLDRMPDSWRSAHAIIREYFFECDWNEVYDFIEFTARVYPHKTLNDEFMASCNVVLEQELSGYRFVGGHVAPITSEEAIATIEKAQKSTSALPTVTLHLQQALSLLSDRKQPDYRNSIKESISAIEAICRAVAQSPKATLGEALKALGPKVPLHPALSGAFDKLYGYTNDAQGIRHALLDVPTLQQEDALFMLVS